MVARQTTSLHWPPQECGVSVDNDFEQPRAIGSLLAEVLANYGLVREPEGEQSDWPGDEEGIFQHEMVEVAIVGSAGASPSLTG